MLKLSEEELCGRIYGFSEIGVPLADIMLKHNNGLVLQNEVKHIREVLFLKQNNKVFCSKSETVY